jgi:hypothetical protein
MLLAVLGNVQAWSFSARDQGVPKPYAYDLVAEIPFWSFGVCVTWPLSVLDSLSGGWIRDDSGRWWIAMSCYCFTIGLIGGWVAWRLYWRT